MFSPFCLTWLEFCDQEDFWPSVFFDTLRLFVCRIMNNIVLHSINYSTLSSLVSGSQSTEAGMKSEAGISVNLGHPQGRALKSKLNFLGRIPCLSLIGIDL
jgi:hypothetical protein